MSAQNEFAETTAADERNPFASPERVDETFDAPPSVGPSFFGAFWYCLRRSFDFKSRANRTEYFGWLAGLAVALFALGLGLGGARALVDEGTAPLKIARILFYGGLTLSFAATIPGAAVWARRLRDRNRGANVWTALGGIAAASALVGALYVAMEVLDLDATNLPELYAAALVVVALGGFVSLSTLTWGPSIFLTGFCLTAWATISGKEEPAFLQPGVVVVLLGLFIRGVWGVWRGTPGPNRFGAERVTPKEAARREREKKDGASSDAS